MITRITDQLPDESAMILAQMSTGQLLRINIEVNISCMPGPRSGSGMESPQPQSAGGVIGRIQPAAELEATGARPIGVEHAIEAWAAEMRRMEYSESHIKNSVRYVTRATDSADATYLDDIGPEEAVAYLQSLADRRCSPYSQRNARSACRNLWSFCVRMKWLRKNPWDDLRTPHLRKTKPWAKFSVDEVRRLILAARANYDEADGRTHKFGPTRPAFYAVLALTGLRKSEAGSQRWSDVDLGDAVLRVTNDKSKRHDTIPLTDECCRILREWREHSTGELVFPHAPTHKSLMRDMERAGVAGADEGRAGQFHRFRRLSISARLMAGSSLADVSKLARHVDPKTTMEYFDAPPDDLRDAAENLRLGENQLDTTASTDDSLSAVIATSEHIEASPGDPRLRESDHGNEQLSAATVAERGFDGELTKSGRQDSTCRPELNQLPNTIFDVATRALGLAERVVALEEARLRASELKGVCCGDSGVSGVARS